MFSFFGLFGQKRRQKCLILTEDSRVVSEEHPVKKGYVVDDKTMEAWGLFPESLILNRKTGEAYTLLCERDAAPISVDGGGTLHKLTEQAMKLIAEENADAELAQIQKKSWRNKLADTTRLVILLFAILIIVMILFGLITSGKLHLPDMGSYFSNMF